jgi:RNA polymerase sigma factor (sigma-70 family)
VNQRLGDAEREKLFVQWTTAHAAIFFRTANAFARGTDRDDLMQELLLAAWKAIPAFRGGSLPSTFLYRVTHNAALAWRRGERARKGRVESYERLSGSHPGTTPTGDAAGDMDGERLQQLYEAIRELPALDRSLVLLWLDGVPYTAIASIHGLSVTNVGVRLTRARQSLGQKLKEATQ